MKRFHKIITEIKTLSEQQSVLKNQRKTVHLKVERSMPAFEAAGRVKANSTRLMHLFIAYAKLKGKEPQLPKKVDWNKDVVNRFIDQFKPEEIAA